VAGKEEKSIARTMARKTDCDETERLCVVNGRSDEHDGEEAIAVVKNTVEVGATIS
jgi:hypothetical protein